MALVSFRHDFIFIKTSKTAGTSLEVDLSRRIEEEAIVTPILPPVAGHVPRNFERPEGTFFNHMSASQMRDFLGIDRFGRMLKFCVEREPVSKCISHFHMLRNSDLHNPENRYQDDWDEYCRRQRFPNDLEKYSEIVDGQRKLLVNRVLRYEALKDELGALLAERGIPDFCLTARAKAEYSVCKLVSPAQVTQEQRQVIYEAFGASCALTGLYRQDDLTRSQVDL